jgi:catechol 2,3-dioxygenase
MLNVAEAAAQGRATRAIAPDTSIGTVRLTVSDLERSRVFYERSLGMLASATSERTLELRTGSEDELPLLELTGDPAAAPPPRRATGLFHFAVLVPTRADLAHALGRLAYARWPLDGASDHHVSEALYLSDPDGNGIEIYRDRPRSQWPRDPGGTIEMTTLRLDLDGLLGELGDNGDAVIPPRLPLGTGIGHVHLKVAAIPTSEAFYADVLGFEVMQRSYPGALFVAAGGYHHHLGLNTWQSNGREPPPSGSLGLRSFELRLPDQQAYEDVLERIGAAGINAEQRQAGTLVRDPSGNGILITV